MFTMRVSILHLQMWPAISTVDVFALPSEIRIYLHLNSTVPPHNGAIVDSRVECAQCLSIRCVHFNWTYVCKYSRFFVAEFRCVHVCHQCDTSIKHDLCTINFLGLFMPLLCDLICILYMHKTQRHVFTMSTSSYRIPNLM